MCSGKTREAKCPSRCFASMWLIPADVNLDHRPRGSMREVPLFLSHFLCCPFWKKVPVSPTEWGVRLCSLNSYVSYMEFCVEICLFSAQFRHLFMSMWTH